MKERIYIFIIITVLLFNSCNKVNSNILLPLNRLDNNPINKILGFNGLNTDDLQIGIISNNKIRFFSWQSGDDNWNEVENVVFYLSDNTKDIFSTGNGIGVVTNNEVIFFELLESVWHEKIELVFNLPNNCQAVFSPFNWRYLNVIVNNKIKFYNFDSNEGIWSENFGLELELPQNTKGVFADEWGGIFIVSNENIIKYYSRELSEKWDEIHRLEIKLQKNFRNAFFQYYLAIYDENDIKYYMSQYPEGTWVEILNAKFDLSAIN